MQQAEGMVTFAFLPLPWDCAVNHAKELIQATSNAEQEINKWTEGIFSSGKLADSVHHGTP